MNRRHLPLIAGLTLVVSGGLVPVAPAVAADVGVDVLDYRFEPAELEVPAGTTVVWTNRGEDQHNVKATNGAFTSPFLAKGESFSHTFATATTVSYFCELHATATSGTMRGTVTVTGDSSSPTPPPARDIGDACDGSAEDGFSDVPQDNPHEAAIDCVVARWEIASGKTPAAYAPAELVTRAQMATFIARTMEAGGYVFPSQPEDAFTDDEGSPHEANINKLKAAGVVGGTGGSSYSPGKAVTRGQMATFLVKAYETTTGGALPAGDDYFADDDDTTHEANTNKAAKAGFAGGYPDGTYRPTASVKRDAMASFIARVLDALVEAGKATPPAS